MRSMRTAAAIGLMVLAVGVSADCLTGVRITSTRASVPNLVSGPTAWSGSVLAVVKEQEGATNNLWIGVYNENFDPLAGDRQVASNSREVIALVWNGTEFGLFYRTNDSRILLQRLDLLGAPIGAPVQITPNRTVYAGDETAAEWSSALNAYVVARAVSQGMNQGVWVTLVNKDGTQRSDRNINVFAAPASQLDLAVTETGTIGVVYVGVADNLVLAVLQESGPGAANVIAPNAGNHIVIAAQDDLFIVARQMANGPVTQVKWLWVDSSHQIVRPDTLLVGGSGDDAWPEAFHITDDEIALAYVDAPRRTDPNSRFYRLRRMTPGGSLISDTLFAGGDVASGRAFSEHSFFWTGTSYISAPVRSTDDRLNSYLVRYCPLVADIDVDHPRAKTGETITFTGDASGGVPSYTYLWRFSDEHDTDAGQTQIKTYTEPGTYTATLTVTDDTGTSATTSFNVIVIRGKQRSVRH